MLFKKVLAGVLAAAAVACLSVSVFAEDRDPRGERYGNKVLGDGTVKITAYSGDEDNVNIPEEETYFPSITGEEIVGDEYNYFINDDGTVTLTTYWGDDINVIVPDEYEGGKVVYLWGTFAYYTNGGNVETVHIPATVIGIYGRGGQYFHGFDGANKLVSITVDENNKYFKSEDGVLFYKDMTALYVYPEGKTDTEYKIPDGVTYIGESAFADCKFLESVELPDSVTEIDARAFASCGSLTKIVIPDSVEEIGERAFEFISDDVTIYGYAGSYAESYAKENGINFVALEKEPTTSTEPSDTTTKEDTVIEDKSTGITATAAEGVLPEGAVLNVEIDEENSTDSAVAFDITVAVDGKPADINGNVTVTIPVPEELKGADTYYVFYKADDGTLTDMKATYKDGVITFTTTHFSTYIVSTVNLLANNKGDSPNTGIEGVAIFAGLAVAAAAAVVISKKRK